MAHCYHAYLTCQACQKTAWFGSGSSAFSDVYLFDELTNRTISIPGRNFDQRHVTWSRPKVAVTLPGR